MGVLHPLPRHVVRTAALAALLTVLTLLALLALPLGELGGRDRSAAPASSQDSAATPAPVVQTAPDWVARPLAPVTVAR